MNVTDLFKNKAVLAIAAGVAVGLGIYTGYIDVSAITALFSGMFSTTPA